MSTIESGGDSNQQMQDAFFMLAEVLLTQILHGELNLTSQDASDEEKGNYVVTCFENVYSWMSKSIQYFLDAGTSRDVLENIAAIVPEDAPEEIVILAAQILKELERLKDMPEHHRADPVMNPHAPIPEEEMEESYIETPQITQPEVEDDTKGRFMKTVHQLQHSTTPFQYGQLFNLIRMILDENIDMDGNSPAFLSIAEFEMLVKSITSKIIPTPQDQLTNISDKSEELNDVFTNLKHVKVTHPMEVTSEEQDIGIRYKIIIRVFG